MLVLNLPFKALMFLTLMRPSLVLFLVLWLKLVKDFLKVRCRLALLPFLISCLIWLDLVASLPLIKERILVIILLLHFLSLMLGSVLVLMLPLLVWLTPDLRIKKSLLKCNWTIRKRLPRCKMRLKKRLLPFSRRLHARIRKTRYMHKMRCLLINRRSLLLALRLLWKTPIFLPLKDIRDEYNYPKKKGIKDECSRLLEASTMKSRRGFAIQRLMNAMRQAHADGWFIVFDTLTLADDRLEAFYDNPNALRDYFRDIGRMVLAAEGRKANDSHADCYQ